MNTKFNIRLNPCPPATVENTDASYTDTVAANDTWVLPDVDIDVNGTKEGEIVSVKKVEVDTNIAPTNKSLVGNKLTLTFAKDVFIKGIFAAGNDTMETLTIDADNAGTYTTITDDGSSGTIELSKNGGAFAAFSGTLILAVSDTLVAKRTITTNAGFYKLTGTF